MHQNPAGSHPLYSTFPQAANKESTISNRGQKKLRNLLKKGIRRNDTITRRDHCITPDRTPELPHALFLGCQRARDSPRRAANAFSALKVTPPQIILKFQPGPTSYDQEKSSLRSRFRPPMNPENLHICRFYPMTAVHERAPLTKILRPER